MRVRHQAHCSVMLGDASRKATTKQSKAETKQVKPQVGKVVNRQHFLEYIRTFPSLLPKAHSVPRVATPALQPVTATPLKKLHRMAHNLQNIELKSRR
jgi:hypothetical protein